MPDGTTELALRDLAPSRAAFLADVLEGLSQDAKQLQPKYFYDEEGSRIFDQICELPEYYPTRTEIGIMRDRGGEIARALGPGAMVIEYGSGSSIKTKYLLDALEDPAAYVPVDISKEHLMRSAGLIDERHSEIEVLPICADFTRPFEVPTPATPVRSRVVYFPGSTIGNFSPEDATGLLRQIAKQIGRDGAALIGADLKKDREVLEAAYDDAKGVTAAFNMNLLTRMNRELGADFDLKAFRHRAVYDEEKGRVEMHLVSTRPQTVHVGGRAFHFAEGEFIDTEHSHKYSLEDFAALAAAAELGVDRVWTDPQARFSVQLLRPASRPGPA